MIIKEQQTNSKCTDIIWLTNSLLFYLEILLELTENILKGNESNNLVRYLVKKYIAFPYPKKLHVII